MAAVMIDRLRWRCTPTAGNRASARELMTNALRSIGPPSSDPGYMSDGTGRGDVRRAAHVHAAVCRAGGRCRARRGGHRRLGSSRRQPVSFKFERLNPVAGLGRMFSVNSLVEVLKALAKAGVIIGFIVALLMGSTDSLLGLSDGHLAMQRWPSPPG